MDEPDKVIEDEDPYISRVPTKENPPLSIRSITLQVNSVSDLASFFRASAEIADTCIEGQACRVTIIVERVPVEPEPG